MLPSGETSPRVVNKNLLHRFHVMNLTCAVMLKPSGVYRIVHVTHSTWVLDVSYPSHVDHKFELTSSSSDQELRIYYY